MTAIPTAVLTQHIAVLGKTGSGKTSTAKLAIEQVVRDGSRVCVLDPIKSDWWGLISSADGKHPGLPFHILGGPRGHVPLHAAAGKAIGEVVASGALPLSILDMADFKPGGQAGFFTDFAPALIRKMRGVLYLVIEEAHLFAPKERSGIGAENMSIHWSKTLATAGRSKGIRLIVVTQRTQALHNALLGSCDTLIAHRLTAPADQKPVLTWLQANTDKGTAEKVAASLSSLKTGQGWLCSGEAQLFELRHFPRIKTYDNTATPTDDSGEHHVKTAAVDTDQLKAIVGEAVKEAEANDPTLLRKKIADLERQVDKSAKSPQAVDQAALEKARAAGESAGAAAKDRELRPLIAERDRIIRTLTGTMGRGAKVAGELAALLNVNGEAMPKTVYQPGKEIAAPPERKAFAGQVKKTVAAQPVAATIPEKRSFDSRSESGDLPKGEAAVLSALIQFPAGLHRKQLTVLTGYKRSSRDAYIQRLREKGLIETAGDGAQVTAAGIAALPNAEPLPTGADLQAYWLARLPQGERAILEQLIAAYPDAVEREALSEATGYQRSSRDAYLQRMRAKQLIEEPGRGTVRASSNLF